METLHVGYSEELRRLVVSTAADPGRVYHDTDPTLETRIRIRPYKNLTFSFKLNLKIVVILLL